MICIWKASGGSERGGLGIGWNLETVVVVGLDKGWHKMMFAGVGNKMIWD